MPLDAEAAKELKQHISIARKMPLNFGLALGKKPEDTALIMHRKREGGLLHKQARKADGVEPAKSCFGTAAVDGNLLTFTCDSDPPAGMKKKCKAFLTSNKLSLKIKILGPDGGEFETGDDDDAAPAGAGSPGEGLGDGPGDGPGDGGQDPGAAPDDAARAKWEAARTRLEPKLLEVLNAGKGDVSKMRAVWALAAEKAEAGDFDVALQAAAALVKLMQAAGDSTRSEAQKESGHVVSDTLTGKALLDDLKSKGDAIKAALGVLPKRVADARQLIADVSQGVKDSDLDFARVALTKIDMLLSEAEPVQKARSEYQMAEGRIASRARAMADLPPDDPTLSPLLGAYRQAMESAMTAATDQDWLVARAALPDWVRTLTELEKAWTGKLDVEGQYKVAAQELGKRGEAITGFSPDAPGHGDIVRNYQAAMTAALDEADKPDWDAALALVPEWRRQLELAEKAHEAFLIRKARFDKLHDPLQGDLAKAMKLGAVTPAIGVLCTQMRAKAAEVKTAVGNQDYEAGVPMVEDLTDLVARLLEARTGYVAQKADWGAKSGAVAAKFAQVEECGALDPTLDGFKTTFDQAVAAMRTKAEAHDFAGALGDLEDVTTKADAFLRAKATWDEARGQVFSETRAEGRGDIAAIPTNGRDDGATLSGIETAMEGSKSLRTSKGLQKLLDEARKLEPLFATVIQSTDPALGQGAIVPFQTAITNCEAYQRDHKADARSSSDREKFAQAQALADHYRAQLAELQQTVPVLNTLAAIDPVALVGNEVGALRALGQIEAIKTSNLTVAAKDLAEQKRRTLVCNMLKADGQTADQRREVLMMAGGEFAESYERQMALGPLAKTADQSRTARDHDSTRLQPARDAENVDRTRRLADRLIADDGRLELAALYACDPDDLAGDSPSSRQTARALTRLREDPEAIALLEGIEAPKKDSPAARMVCATLGLEAGSDVSAAQARQAALCSLMAELRQKDVGSCFATQVAINIHDTDPKRYLQDISDMLSKGVISRVVNGETVEIPIETKMSDKALETSTVKLKRGDDPIVTGSSTGGALDPAEKTRLEEAPAFQAAFDTLGIDADDREEAMKNALERMQASEEFQRNQNAKALHAAVATIADATQRNAVFKAAMEQMDTNGATVKTALEAAMRTTGVPDADPGNQDTAVNAAAAAFDAIGASEEFDVEPGLVVRQMAMDKVGLTEADLAKQKAYERAAAAFASDTRPDSDPGRQQDMRQVTQLQQECATIRPKILLMEDLKTACYDAYTGGEDNRLLRSYEYTLTALAEESATSRMFGLVQNYGKESLQTALGDVADAVKADPAIGLANPDIDRIRDALFNRYQTLFDAGTKHAYDAAIQAAEVSADGSSSRGGFYLYDIRGISNPDDWIKIDDQKKYAACVRGNVMLACKELYDDDPDAATRETARFLAEKLADTVAGQGFATSLQAHVDTRAAGDNRKGALPWQIAEGGFSEDVLEVLEERTPTKTSMGTPTDSKDLLKKVGNQLKALWDGDAALRQAADDDPEVATVNSGNAGVHAFSLTPGEPRLRAILESANVDTAIDAFQNDEKTKWDGALSSIPVTSRAEVEAFMKEYAIGWGDVWYDSVWTALDTGAQPKTGKDVVDAATAGFGADDLKNFGGPIGQTVATKVIPPIEPAKLQAKLEKVARALDVPDDLVAAVTSRAKQALDAKDATQATMADIKDEVAKAMTAEGMDSAGVDQSKVNAALREPAGLVFADSNWGSAEHRTKYAMVVNPVTGEVEMWCMSEDGSNAFKMDEDGWVKKEWSTVS